MVTVESQMLPLGTKAINFSLTNVVDGKTVNLSNYAAKRAILIIFMCNHCPYVIHIREQFKSFTDEYLAKDVAIIAINANSTLTHPQDGPEEMKKLALEKEWNFPYLFDDTQEVAKAYKAACTPDFFLFNQDLKLVYRGQYDDSRPKRNTPITGKDLRAALDAVLENRKISQNQKPSSGCNIKWHPGKEPEYFIVTKK